MSNPDPVLRLYRLYVAARLPQRADRAAGGTLPTRAYRFCEAVTTAAAFGWHVFSPLSFQLLWDGTDIHWTSPELDDWQLLRAAALPGLLPGFNDAAPAALADCAPPFLTALPEPGHVQVWTGLFARTAPGWSLHVRAPANFPLPGGHVAYEGIVETDRWFGPLFANFRLTRTGAPIVFDPELPLLQVQPVPRTVLDEATQNATELLAGPEDLTAEDWQDYERSVVRPALDPARRPGAYAAAARRRQRGGCPLAAALRPS
jgi:hypothetical protein